MKAILCTQYCGPDDLVLTEVPDPVAGPGEAVIAIKSAALNFFDLLMIQGKYQIKPPFPFSPAAEVAGVIESIGSGVSDLKPGDRVVASCGHNGAREKIALPANAIVKIPDNLDFDRAAGIIIIYGTALHALEDRASLKPGETMAVLGAAGGTGLAACELGKLMGLKVIACASSDEKLEFAKAHGAELGLNYATEDLKEGLRRLTGGKGADIVFDPVGGSYAEAALRSIAWEGRFLVIGFAAGEIPKMPLNLALLKGCDIRGVFWGAWARLNAQKNRANLVKLVKWAAEGKISSHVERTVIGCEQILGEGKLRYHPLQFDPEAPAHTFAVFGQPVGRLKTHGVFSCHCPGSRKTSAADRRGGYRQNGDIALPPQAARSGYAELPGDRIHRGCKLDVAHRDPAGVVGRQHDFYRLVNIAPFRVMIALFSDQRDP